MKKTYGNTWWGQQWLNALQHIDYSNRLPRGRSYANTGKVSHIEVDAHQIAAKVRGRRPRPYRVHIELQTFTAKQRRRLIDRLRESPFLLSQLLNRELPEGLGLLCQEEHIPLFPKRWEDLRGQCSCPDWAVPCKHLAAVLYLLANEIDNNPLLLFDLHGMDLLGELTQSGFELEASQPQEVLALEDILLEDELDYSFFDWSPAVFTSLDLSAVPNTLPSLLAVLADNPPFYPLGDFKQLLEKSLALLPRAMSKAVKALSQDSDLHASAEKVEQLQIVLDKELQLIKLVATDFHGEQIQHFQNTGQVVDWLQQLPLRMLNSLSIPLRGLVLTYRLAQRLCQAQAIMPELIALPNGRYGLRWLPAYFNQQVWDIGEAVDTLTFPGMLRVQLGKQTLYLEDEEVFPTLLSLFLGFFVKLHRKLNYNQEVHPVVQLFFLGQPQSFSGREWQHYPATISTWLEPLALGGGEHTIFIQITDSETDTGFTLTLAIQDQRTALTNLTPFQELMQNDDYKDLRMPVLRDLAMVAKLFPQLTPLVEDPALAELYFSSEDFAEVLLHILPVVEIVGVEVVMPKALRKILRPQASLQIDADKGEVSPSGIISLEQLLRFNWQVALGEEVLDIEAFKQMLKSYRGIVKFNDEYVHFEEDEIKKLLDKLTAPPQLKPMEAIQIALAEAYEQAPINISAKARNLLHELFGAQDIKPPQGLLATLRPYQQRGYEWLYKNSRLGIGSIIADDMGLGKTLQVIATLLQLKVDGALRKDKALVVVPTTLLSNWEREVQKFAPDLKLLTYHGSQRKLADFTDEYDILLSTYGVVRADVKQLSKRNWTAVVIDEAQQIKNPATAQTKAIKKLRADVRIAMSGTPVENRLAEYWSLFDFTNKAYLGNLTHFKNEIARPIEMDRDQHKIQWFQRITAPFILRRLKTDKQVISDLPEKVEIDQYVTLSEAQAALYQGVVDTHLEVVEQADGIARRGLILKLITALKQVCNHPRQFLKKGSLAAKDSGKVELLYELLHQLLENGEKVLIFTQYREMGELLAKLIETEFGIQPPFLHGGVSRKKRDEMVETFQQDRHTPIFLLSLKAGGTGLNLTAASQVIHFDLWWNPAVEAQATDRAYRIGQTRNVLVHRLITQHSFEEKINQLLHSKKELADLAVSQGEQWIGELSNRELRELVQLE